MYIFLSQFLFLGEGVKQKICIIYQFEGMREKNIKKIRSQNSLHSFDFLKFHGLRTLVISKIRFSIFSIFKELKKSHSLLTPLSNKSVDKKGWGASWRISSIAWLRKCSYKQLAIEIGNDHYSKEVNCKCLQGFTGWL